MSNDSTTKTMRTQLMAALALVNASPVALGGNCACLRIARGRDQHDRIHAGDQEMAAPTSLDEPVTVGTFHNVDDDDTGGFIAEVRYDSLREFLRYEWSVAHQSDAYPEVLQPPEIDHDEDDEEEDSYATSRVQRVRAALDGEAGYQGMTDGTRLAELLEDIRFFCDANGYDFAALDRQAYRLYVMERE